ncbi:tryptophan synthase subunit alpha, partial [Sulfolobus sp. A20-N-F6]
MLVVYMTLGYPDVENFLKFITSLESAGADVLELGIPPKYAKYDGPVIRKSYDRVKTQIKDIWRLMRQVRDSLSIPIVALTYLEDWINELKTFLDKLRENGINGVLFPDL